MKVFNRQKKTINQFTMAKVQLQECFWNNVKVKRAPSLKLDGNITLLTRLEEFQNKGSYEYMHDCHNFSKK